MPEEDSSLERLRSRLNAAQTTTPGVSNLPTRTAEIPRGWTPPPTPMPGIRTPHKQLPLSTRFLIYSGGFFVVAGLVATILLLLGGRSVSTNNIIISVDGPTTAAGGDTVSLLITVENHNPIPIRGATLAMTFPNDTRSAEDVTQPFTRDDEDLGDIAAGEAVTRTVRAVLFGKENQTVTIPMIVEYETDNSNSIFEKKYEYTLTLTTSPVSVTATSVSQVSSGQPLTLNISVRSNANKPLNNIALKGEFPFGFTTNSTSIEGNNGLFALGTLQPGQEKKFTLTGVLTGGDGDERIFRFTVGSTASSTNGALGVVYATTESDITIAKPFLDVGLTFNGSSDVSTIAAGDTVQGVLRWKNTLPTSILDTQLTVTLSGTGFDKDTVTTQNGFYQSSNNTIRFDSDTESGLSSLAPGDTGAGTFSFQMKSGDALSSLKNPSVTVNVSVSGRRVNEAGVQDTLSSTLSKTIKVSSGLGFSSKVVRTVGPFTNTGPWPPEVGKETTYTVMLSAANGVNSTAGAVATMTLPSYVKFLGAAISSNGSVNYTESTRTVKWNVGDMSSGATKQAAFQISFLPSSSQQGGSPTLVSPQTMTGTDRFTQASVTATAPSLDTQTLTDPAYQGEEGTVE